jgi:hypothetical protein
MIIRKHFEVFNHAKVVSFDDLWFDGHSFIPSISYMVTPSIHLVHDCNRLPLLDMYFILKHVIYFVQVPLSLIDVI